MSLTQQELDALHGGMLAGGTIARRDAKIAAFGAIRRAAKVARRWDAIGSAASDPVRAQWSRICATAIREAITNACWEVGDE